MFYNHDEMHTTGTIEMTLKHLRGQTEPSSCYYTPQLKLWHTSQSGS